MEPIEVVKNIAQIIYYIALSIAGPLALIAYLKARETDRLEREYKTYDELDNKLFEYQKMALEYYDLDILDVANDDPSLAFDKKRKQELVAFSILFSLFERAFLMFNKQSDLFKKKQWSGWKYFLNDFIRRERIQSAWQLSKSTYDTDFQVFMDEKIAAILSVPPVSSPVPTPSATPVATPTATLTNGTALAQPSGNTAEAARASLSHT